MARVGYDRFEDTVPGILIDTVCAVSGEFNKKGAIKQTTLDISFQVLIQ